MSFDNGNVTFSEYIKILVWHKYIGKYNKIGTCSVCKTHIFVETFECGFYQSLYNGGKRTLKNIRPICVSCHRKLGQNGISQIIFDTNQVNSICEPMDIDREITEEMIKSQQINKQSNFWNF